MWRVICFITLIVCAIYCNSCSDSVNNKGVLPNRPELVHPIVPNGKMYHLKNGNETIRIVVVRGSARDYGRAIGQLLKKEIAENLVGLIESCKLKALQYIGFLPPFIKSFLLSLIKPLLHFALNLTWIFTRDYIPERYFEELKGMAEGSGLPYMELVRVNLFPELIKASCSLVGVWGPATADHNAYFLRAFDWNVEAPVTKYPLITVYHSDEIGSIPFAIFGYVGLIGAFTALNGNGLGIAEKQWYLRLTDPVDITVVGKPWPFVLRDIAQFSDTLDSAINALKSAHRTCSIHVGVVTAKDNAYKGMWYAADRLEVYDDKSFPQNDTKHWLIDGANYIDKGIQPSKNDCLAILLQEKHGKITMDYLYEQVAARHQTGNCQVLVMNMREMKLYFAFSTFDPRVMAYEKPMFYLDLNELFNEM